MRLVSDLTVNAEWGKHTQEAPAFWITRDETSGALVFAEYPEAG